MPKVVMFTRVSKTAKAWAEKVARSSGGKEHVNDVINRLLLAHKQKTVRERQRKRGSITA